MERQRRKDRVIEAKWQRQSSRGSVEEAEWKRQSEKGRVGVTGEGEKR